MQDSTLLWAALAVSVIGIVCLFFLSQASDLPVTPLDKIDGTEDYEEVMIEATVTHVRSSGNITLMYLTKLEEVKAVVFDGVSVPEGALVQVKGRVQEYRGEKEIIVEEIRVVG